MGNQKPDPKKPAAIPDADKPKPEDRERPDWREEEPPPDELQPVPLAPEAPPRMPERAGGPERRRE